MTVNPYRWATLIITVIVVIVGGVICIVHPETLPFSAYIKDVAQGVGLLAIALGIDQHSRP